MNKLNIVVKKTHKIPDKSLISNRAEQFHYIDSFQSSYIGKKTNINNIGRVFLSCGPKWADTLMDIRDKVVGIFGLKTQSDSSKMGLCPNDYIFEKGEQIGIFKLFDINESELILGEDDKHLSFRFSILYKVIDDKNIISLTTVVEFKNLFGRLYFVPVKPVHQLIVKKTLKEMINKLDNNTLPSL